VFRRARSGTNRLPISRTRRTREKCARPQSSAANSAANTTSERRRAIQDRKIRSLNPARPAQVIGVHQKAKGTRNKPCRRLFGVRVLESGLAEKGLAVAGRPTHPPAEVRLCAWLTFGGQNWAEADADGRDDRFPGVLFPRSSPLASATTPIQYAGNYNELLYIPLGVGAVIPPWNSAIMAGMTVMAIVTGNTVILKPSSDSPTIAAKFVEVLEEAGMPMEW
jgi:1-pyrroline-5-carboxylate dehydrogenase